MIDEIKAAEAEKERVKKDEEEKSVGEGDTEEKSKSKDVKRIESRDWKRNGMCDVALVGFLALVCFFADERWLESLDMKIAVLINRDGVDPRDYGGKSYEEYEPICWFHQS
jgi:hypothetical protein